MLTSPSLTSTSFRCALIASPCGIEVSAKQPHDDRSGRCPVEYFELLTEQQQHFIPASKNHFVATNARNQARCCAAKRHSRRNAQYPSMNRFCPPQPPALPLAIGCENRLGRRIPSLERCLGAVPRPLGRALAGVVPRHEVLCFATHSWAISPLISRVPNPSSCWSTSMLGSLFRSESGSIWDSV